MKRMPALAVLLALAACGTHAPSTAPGVAQAEDVEKTFLALDEDRDGYLTRREAAESPVLNRRFREADANRDGLLSRYEYNSPAWRPFGREPD